MNRNCVAKKQMADLSKYAIADANGIRWAEAKDTNGVLYRHGFLNTDTIKESDGNEASEVVKASADDGGKVDWPLGTSGTISPAICHVTSYEFFETPDDLIYDYQLRFFVTGGWVRTFTDDKKVDYSCTTVTNGKHYIQFSSSSTSPCICNVS